MVFIEISLKWTEARCQSNGAERKSRRSVEMIEIKKM